MLGVTYDKCIKILFHITFEIFKPHYRILGLNLAFTIVESNNVTRDCNCHNVLMPYQNFKLISSLES